MGTTYSAKVFFGAWVAAKTPLGEILDGYIDREGGTPAKTEIDRVEIWIAGNVLSGDKFYTIEANGSVLSFDRDDEIDAPAFLTENPNWRPGLARFLEMHDATDLSIGWHFVGSAM